VGVGLILSSELATLDFLVYENAGIISEQYHSIGDDFFLSCLSEFYSNTHFKNIILN